MQLSGQASQYWNNVENRRAARDRPPIDIWDRMKEELETKYASPSFSAHLMDNWHQYTQGNKSAKKYVEKFDDSSSDAVPFIRNVKLKFFLDLEPALEMTYRLNC